MGKILPLSTDSRTVQDRPPAHRLTYRYNWHKLWFDNDKGKPVVRRGRKARSLLREIVRLPTYYI